MLKLPADEHIPRQLIRSLIRREPELDIVQAQAVGLRNAPDPQLLAWAAQEERVLITLDVNTVPEAAYQRVVQGEPMPGVFAPPWEVPLGRVIEDLLVLAVASLPSEWEGQVIYLPL